MADWTNLPNERFEPGAPARGVDARRLRDNPIAIAEGAAGAPRIQTDGINNGAVTNAKVAAGSLGAEKFQTGTDERNWVLARCAAASVGAVGTYAWLNTKSSNAIDSSAGFTTSGSSLEYSSFSIRGGDTVMEEVGGSSPSGTWRLMGQFKGGFTVRRGSLFLRIS